MESNINNRNQRSEKIITKRLVSDNLFSLMNLGVGLKKLVTEKDLIKIKNIKNEKEFFGLNLFEPDNEIEEDSHEEEKEDEHFDDD